MAEWLRAFIAGENVGKEASNSSIFPMTPLLPWSVVHPHTEVNGLFFPSVGMWIHV